MASAPALARRRSKRSTPAALDALIEELAIPRVVLVGHDFGGPVALALLARRPQAASAIALFAANTFTDTPIPFPLSLATSRIVGKVAGRILLSSFSLRLMLRRGVGPGAARPGAAHYLGDREQRRAIATIFEGSLTRLAELYTPIERQLREVAVPSIVGWGDRDPFFPPAQGVRTAEAAGARFQLCPGAGHFLPHERPLELADSIASLVSTAPLQASST